MLKPASRERSVSSLSSMGKGLQSASAEVVGPFVMGSRRHEVVNSLFHPSFCGSVVTF